MQTKLITLLFFGVLFSSQLFAAVTLRQLQVKSGNELDLSFDGKVEKRQIQVDYLNDIIQISLSDVAIYPAKMIPVTDGDFTKIFVYQYSPKVVRCRLTVSGKAEDFK